jgi:peptidoglycan/xylan/chitin deacetylase (PgdA/CDA1 family)
MTAPGHWLTRAAGTLLGRRYPFVLCYHGIGPAPTAGDPFRLFVGRAQFVEHLDLIEEHGYTLLTVADLWRRIQGGSGATHNASVTFDDGLVSAAREGIPLLLERGLPCSMFISSGLMGKPHPEAGGAMIMTGAEVAELARAGVEIGAHSVDHARLDDLAYGDALDQLHRSKAELEDLLGQAVDSMAYPYGRTSEQTVRAAREAGYRLACVCTGPGPWQPLRIPREPVYSSVTPLRLRLKMAGLYGPVYAINDVHGSMSARANKGSR